MKNLSRKPLHAELALKCLPAVSLDILSIFPALLRVEPLSEALQMNMAHRPFALTRRDHGVILLVLFSEANPADFGIQSKLSPFCELKLE